jgi:hypothetical protein
MSETISLEVEDKGSLVTLATKQGKNYQVTIKLEYSQYYAGEKVKGQIQVKGKKPFSKIPYLEYSWKVLGQVKLRGVVKDKTTYAFLVDRHYLPKKAKSVELKKKGDDYCETDMVEFGELPASMVAPQKGEVGPRKER